MIKNTANDPLVSVIMGIYNCSATLGRAIESILDQTYHNWELILCDDCSTDDTYEIAKAYSDRYSNIILLKNERNMKLAYSLNRCLDAAHGEYIARMDADDMNLPERFEKQVDFLEKHNEYAVVSCRSIVFDEDGDKGIRGESGSPDKYSMLKTVPFMHPTIMMRKSAYDKLEGYTVCKRTNRGQDLDLWFRFYEKGFKGYILDEPLYKYHESEKDFKKRTVKTALGYIATKLYGFRLLKFPIYTYILALRPLVSALIPNRILRIYKKGR
jgi:glycosyltransferase EpsE